MCLCFKFIHFNHYLKRNAFALLWILKDVFRFVILPHLQSTKVGFSQSQIFLQYSICIRHRGLSIGIITYIYIYVSCLSMCVRDMFCDICETADIFPINAPRKFIMRLEHFLLPRLAYRVVYSSLLDAGEYP